MSKSETNLLQRQFLPGINRFVYWLKTPIGWLIVAAIASALVAASLAPQMWMIFGLLVSLIVLGIVWPYLAMSGVSCVLKFDRKRCSENGKVLIRLIIKNNFWLPAWGLSLERGFFQTSEPANEQIAVSLARIPASSTTEFSWEYYPSKRGVYPTENPVLTCGFPFGLWYSAKTVSFEKPLVVWPETYPLGSMPPVAGENQLVSETFADQSGFAGEKIGVRPFQEGDSLRLVHWGQTARFDKLIVCEQQTPSRQTVEVIVELTTALQKQYDGDAEERDEICLRIGASICQEFHAHSYFVRFRIGNETHEVDARGASFRKLMDNLASLNIENQTDQSPFAKATQSKTTQTKDFVFLVTTDADAEKSLNPNLKLILLQPGARQEYKKSKSWLVVDPLEVKTILSKSWMKACQTSWQGAG